MPNTIASPATALMPTHYLLANGTTGHTQLNIAFFAGEIDAKLDALLICSALSRAGYFRFTLVDADNTTIQKYSVTESAPVVTAG